MAKFRKINDFCDRAMGRMDELGDDAIQAMRNTPEAKARQAALRTQFIASEKRAADRREAGKADATAKAKSAWNVGDEIITRRGECGTVQAIEGSSLVVEIAGVSRKFAASMVKSA